MAYPQSSPGQQSQTSFPAYYNTQNNSMNWDKILNLENILHDQFTSGGYKTSGGLDNPSNLMALFQKYFSQAGSNLNSQAQRSVSGAGRLAGGITSSQGLNPYASIMRARNNAYDQFVPQFGNLATQEANTMTKVPMMSQQFRQMDFQNLLNLLQTKAGLKSDNNLGEKVVEKMFDFIF